MYVQFGLNSLVKSKIAPKTGLLERFFNGSMTEITHVQFAKSNQQILFDFI